jgi:uncharacterized protein YkwD
MKTKLLRLYVLSMLVLFASCSKDELDQNNTANYEIDLTIVQKNDSEMTNQIFQLVNDHRLSIGLSPLVLDEAYGSAYAVDHTDYMIGVSQINHDNFHIRSGALQNRGAQRVGENVATGYNDAETLVFAWLNSPGHREVIEGNFTHTGFGVFQNNNNRYFFTQIFYKM